MTFKNQMLVHKMVISKLSLSEEDKAGAASDGVNLTPSQVQETSDEAEPVQRKIEELGITEADIEDAVEWARANPAKDSA